MVEKYYLPGFCSLFYLNDNLFFLKERHPEWFKDNIEFSSVYDCFPGMIWNGGRGVAEYLIPEEEIKRIIYFFNGKNIPLRFTLTNSLLEEEHLHDEYCNKIIDIASKSGMNEIIINSPLLEEYLRNKYENNFKWILSTTRAERDADKINELCEKYYLIVIDYRDAKNKDFLQKLKYKDKIEILVNESCHYTCPYRKQHYENISRVQLNPSLKNLPTSCQYKQEVNIGQKSDRGFAWVLKYNSQTIISADEITNDYVPMGFSNFKLEGRGAFIYYALDSYVHYFFKDEYKDIARTALIANVLLR